MNVRNPRLYRSRKTSALRSRSPFDRSDMPVFPPHDAGDFIPAAQWSVFRAAMEAARKAGVRFALGGGLAVSFYTGQWRGTKDIDLYIEPSDRDRLVAAVSEAGLVDYFDTCGYDRKWIYRATANGTIVDIIWALANHRALVDEPWLTEGATVELFGDSMKVVAVEELVFSKIHVLQRERSDWPDIMNLLYSVGPYFDWERLLDRLAGEERLLGSVLMLFSWLAPGRADAFPEWLWDRLDLPYPEPGAQKEDARIVAIDSRPWFVGQSRT